jgi:uncharacterized protein YndB with AHSA1/START domain
MENARKLEHVLEIRIKGSIEAVWAEITKRGGVQRPLMDSVLVTDLKPGDPFRYVSANRRYWFVRGTILEVEPPRRLVHTYQTSWSTDPESRVTWDLESLGDEVRVRLVHDRFETATQTYEGVKDGWSKILTSLKRWVETGDITLGTKLFYAFFRLQFPFLPKSAREG